MTRATLGRLEPVKLRDIWTREAAEFTPWLTRPENLSVLGETLGIDLELEAQERSVGPFRADILCKDIATNSLVLVENQLERTDHIHLGQLLTYASGLEAVTIVWVAAQFTDEHRSTLDWLNRITDVRFRFFGLEVELWRIGDSLPAPRFNVISKPNDWSQSVAQAADVELSDTRVAQRAYWAALHAVLSAEGGPVSGHQKPQPQSWMGYPIGRSGFTLVAGMIRLKNKVRAELYISGEKAKGLLASLKGQREAIEGKLGYHLEWEELPTKRDCRVACYLNDVDPENEADWARQHEWLARHLNDLHRVLAPRVRTLKATLPPESE